MYVLYMFGKHVNKRCEKWNTMAAHDKGILLASDAFLAKFQLYKAGRTLWILWVCVYDCVFGSTSENKSEHV